MKKSVFRFLTALSVCCLAMTTLFSCIDFHAGDKGKLNGKWLTTVDFSQPGEHHFVHLLLEFSADGICTNTKYDIYPDEPENYSERLRRHSIYAVDDATHILTWDDGNRSEMASYEFKDGGLVLLAISDNADGSVPSVYEFYRPTANELKQLKSYDASLWGDDYVGRWFGSSEVNGLHTFVMVEFTEEGRLHTRRYSLYGDDCTRTQSTQVYYDYDASDNDKVLEVHAADDYSKISLWTWNVKDNLLTLGNYENPQQQSSTYHPLTADDIELMSALDKKVK